MRKCLALSITGSMLFILSGCAVIVGERVMGFENGKFVNDDISLKANYAFPFEKVWAATEQAMAELQASGVSREKRISKGEINAVLKNEQVRVTVEYSAPGLTAVAVRAGLTGDSAVSQSVLDRIKDHLAKS